MFKSPKGTGPISGILDFESDSLIVEFEIPRLARSKKAVYLEIPVASFQFFPSPRNLYLMEPGRVDNWRILTTRGYGKPYCGSLRR
jgi:hypothetical protein